MVCKHTREETAAAVVVGLPLMAGKKAPPSCLSGPPQWDGRENWNGESEKTHDLRVGSLVSEGGLGVVVVVGWQQTEMGQKGPKKQNNK